MASTLSPSRPSASGVCPFTKIPIETLLRMTAYLPTRDFLALRLTCRSIEQATFSTFGRDFFGKRQFMVADFSLEVLLAIASHPRLAAYVRTVILGLDTFHPALFLSRSDNTRRAGEQAALIRSGTATGLLHKAFRRLPNLAAVELRDYNSHTRFRDNGAWTSYGASTARTQRDSLGEPTFRTAPATLGGIEYAANVLLMTLVALGKSGRRPPTINANLRDGQAVTAFYGPLMPSLSPDLLPVLSQIQTLCLRVRLDGGVEDVPLYEFLHTCSAVQHLRLNFSHTSGYPDQFQLLNWLTGRPAVPQDPLPSLPPPPELPGPYLRTFTQLDLGSLTCLGPPLLALIRRSAASLTGLSLHRVSMHGTGQVWHRFFRQLLRIPDLDLRTLSLRELAQPIAIRPDSHHSRASRSRIHTLHAPASSGTDQETQVFYRGSDWRGFVTSLLPSLLPPLPLPASDDDDDEDMADDDGAITEDGDDGQVAVV